MVPTEKRAGAGAEASAGACGTPLPAAPSKDNTLPPRNAHEPLLLWLLNHWAKVLPLLKARVEKLDPSMRPSCWTAERRDADIGALDHNIVFAGARPVELTAMREVLSSHPFLFNAVWCRAFAKEIKITAKKHKGERGPVVLFAFGDVAEHAPDQEHALPDFSMSVAPYHLHDLYAIAKHNLNGKEEARAAQSKAVELAAKRQEIACRVEQARAAQNSQQGKAARADVERVT